MSAMISIRSLSKTYQRGNQPVPVLLDIDLEIDAGDYVSLMGPSGSGKSTLLNLIAGIDKPSSGTLLIGGVDIASLAENDLAAWRASNVGFVFQFYNLMPVLNAFENVELPLLLTDLDRTSADDVLKLLDRLNEELGKTIVMVTHDPKCAARAKRLVHLEKGILLSGPSH